MPHNGSDPQRRPDRAGTIGKISRASQCDHTYDTRVLVTMSKLAKYHKLIPVARRAPNY